MSQLTCPLCGMPVRVPKTENKNRYLCKKCHTPFHLDKSGTPVVGEAPAVDEFEVVKQKVREKVDQLPIRKIVMGLAALLVVWFGVRYLFGPTERLDLVAEKAAKAVAENDPDYLKSIAAPDTAEDVGRWFDQVHSRLDQARQRWNGKDEAVEVHVKQEDPAKRKGEVGVIIQPTIGTARDVSIANPTEATASAPTPVDMEMVWTLNKWGHWTLDGRETLAMSQPRQ